MRIFSPWKIRLLRPGLNPRTWVPKASTLPLDHRSRWDDLYHYLYILLCGFVKGQITSHIYLQVLVIYRQELAYIFSYRCRTWGKIIPVCLFILLRLKSYEDVSVKHLVEIDAFGHISVRLAATSCVLIAVCSLWNFKIWFGTPCRNW